MGRKPKATGSKPAPSAKGAMQLPATPNSGDRTEALSKYNVVADSARLNDIRLMKLEFSVSPEAPVDESSDHEKSKPGLFYDVSAVHIEADCEAGFAAAVFSCEVESTLPEHSYFSCKAAYFVSYDGLENCDAEAAKVFVGRVGRFACYPYFRTLVATLDWAASAHLPPLPVLRERPPGARGPKS